ncbi:MAG: hypothetical protein FJ197_12695 [Gammaproteobacteria bacterium]|nr:hypothetical protein [Gammaproteobacteria bacterium]
MLRALSDTRRLSQASLKLATASRLPRSRSLVAAALCLAVIAYAAVELGRPLLAGLVGNARLETERQNLDRQLAEARVELEVERAARTELQRRTAELESQVADLNQQIDFLASRSTSAR